MLQLTSAVYVLPYSQGNIRIFKYRENYNLSITPPLMLEFVTLLT